MKAYIILQETSRHDIIQHVVVKGVFLTEQEALEKKSELEQERWNNFEKGISKNDTVVLFDVESHEITMQPSFATFFS